MDSYDVGIGLSILLGVVLFGVIMYGIYQSEQNHTERQRILTTKTCKVVRYLPCDKAICEVETREPCEVK
jgi:hypothetical protein